MGRSAPIPLSDPDTATEPIVVELLGVARWAAGCSRVELPYQVDMTLADVLVELVQRHPRLAGPVVDRDGALIAGFVFGRADAELLRDLSTPVAPGERLLLLSTCAGGCSSHRDATPTASR